jgi:hypothetical protein
LNFLSFSFVFFKAKKGAPWGVVVEAWGAEKPLAPVIDL